MRLRDMKYIGFKHQRENKQNSDNKLYQLIQKLTFKDINNVPILQAKQCT